ncbi:unnamed protein product [Strongylus vulgaris]|uniref:Uncharacterized protein n=1 Tax=Strongylus vulgaris TaxID=40348 RepID=A0A3P7LSR7_STRVU|nr:unnamed protein product [Strongylus vulgaris]
MTLVAPPPQQCPSMPSPTSVPNGVAPSPPPPCSGCIKLHADIKQNMQQMMDKFDLIYMRLESLMNEKEKNRLIVHDQEMSESGSDDKEKNRLIVHDQEMSESGSDDKDVPSPADSRASPNTAQGSRKRKPNKEAVHRVADDGQDMANATSGVSEAPAAPATPSTPASTPATVPTSGFGDMDPLAQQQQLLQFIMQQSLGAAAASSTHPAPASTPQATQGATSMPMTPSTPISNMKSEQPDPQVLMEQLQQQFKEVRSVPSYLSHNVLRHSHRHWLIPSNLIIGYPFGIPRRTHVFVFFAAFYVHCS